MVWMKILPNHSICVLIPFQLSYKPTIQGEKIKIIQKIALCLNNIFDFWWRTTSVATKARYHGAGGVLSCVWTYLLSFVIVNFLGPHVFKRDLAYFPLPFRLPGGFFPFRDPIREALPLCEPSYFYEYV